MIQLITEPWYGEFSHTLFAIHQLRHRVFKVRMDWDVQISGDMEVDKFDSLHPAYLAQLSDDGRVQGCVRLLPTKGPTMLRDTFPALLNGQPMPMSPQIWESSRFAIDARLDTPKGEHGIACATYELFAGMVEFGLSRHLSDIVTVTEWKGSCGALGGRYVESALPLRLGTLSPSLDIWISPVRRSRNSVGQADFPGQCSGRLYCASPRTVAQRTPGTQFRLLTGYRHDGNQQH